MGSDQRRRTRSIGVRVDDIELLEIEEKARGRGLSTPSYIRSVVLECVSSTKPRKAPPSLDVKLLAEAVGALGKVGNNLNQIARRLNEGQGVGRERLFKALDELGLTMNELLKVIKLRENVIQRDKTE